MFKFELGRRAKDSISTLEGVILGRTEYLTGCRQYLVKPEGLDKDGKPRESFWFDEDRLQIAGEVVEMKPEAPGGPNLETSARKE